MTHQIIVGDMLIELARLPENSVDSIVCDPPYEVGLAGLKWDSTGIAFNPETWKACLRVLKPGGYLLAFGATRTIHQIASAIEMAGFVIRDQLAWLYATGYPKGQDIAKAIDKDAGHWRGKAGPLMSGNGSMSGGNYARTDKGEPITELAKAWDGWNTTLRPAFEPIVVVQKPLVEKTIYKNVITYGTGALNIGATGIDKGDGVVGYPTNVILDDVSHSFLEIDNPGMAKHFFCAKPSKAEREFGLEGLEPNEAGKRNIHATVKPLKLMRYLVKLVTKSGGLTLDPFCGSGTTGMAAVVDGFNFIGIELDVKHAEIATARIEAMDK